MNLLSFLLMILFTATCIVVAELEFPFQYEVRYFAYLDGRQFESNVVVFHEYQKFHYRKNDQRVHEGTWEWNKESQVLTLNYFRHVQCFHVYKANANGDIPVQFKSTTSRPTNPNLLRYTITSFSLVGTPSVPDDNDLLAKMNFPFEIGKEYYASQTERVRSRHVLIFRDTKNFFHKRGTTYIPNEGTWTWDGYSRQLTLIYLAKGVTQTWQIWSQEANGKIPVNHISSISESFIHRDLLATSIFSFSLEKPSVAPAAIDPNSYCHNDQVYNHENFVYPEHSDRMAPVTDEGEPSAPNYNNYNEQDYYTGTSDYSVLDDFTPEDYHIYFDPNFKQ